MDLNELVAILREELPRIRKLYSVRSLGLFGSVVRGEQRRGSDLDVLVEFDRVPGLLRFLELEAELSSLLGRRVDLVQKEALKPAIGRRVSREVVEV